MQNCTAVDDTTAQRNHRPKWRKKAWFTAMKYICEYWMQQKIRGNHFQEIVNMHLMNVLDFSVGCRIAPPLTIPRHKETTGPNGGKKAWFTANEIYM